MNQLWLEKKSFPSLFTITGKSRRIKLVIRTQHRHQWVISMLTMKSSRWKKASYMHNVIMKTCLEYNWACLAKVTDGETIIHAFAKGICGIARLSWESLCKLDLLNKFSFGKLSSCCHNLRDCYETDVSSLCMSWLVRGKKHFRCSNFCAEESIRVVWEWLWW